MADTVNMKDFSKKEKRQISFTLDEVVYTCYPRIQAPVLQQLTTATEELNLGNAAEKASLFFSGVMPGEQSAQLSARLADPWDDFGEEDALEIMLWLMEAYGLRPTQSSSGKSGGSRTGGAGTRSGAGASRKGSTR